ncbi:unnamed protein product [Victoria cruziana]
MCRGIFTGIIGLCSYASDVLGRFRLTGSSLPRRRPGGSFLFRERGTSGPSRPAVRSRTAGFAPPHLRRVTYFSPSSSLSDGRRGEVSRSRPAPPPTLTRRCSLSGRTLHPSSSIVDYQPPIKCFWMSRGEERVF